MRRQFTPTQKAAVALAALKGDKTINQVASEHEVNPTQVKLWRDEAKAAMADVFAGRKRGKSGTEPTTATQSEVDELHRVIGVRDAELEWLKKRFMDSGCSPHASSLRPHDLANLVDPNHPQLTIARQAELLGLSRRSYYYRPVVNEAEEARLKVHINAIDEIYTKRPYYGTRRMQYQLERSYDICIGRDRIRHLMAMLGLEAIYPRGPNTSQASPNHAIYPYLLKGLAITSPNQVWGSDITYIRTATGFVYLVAFIDWHSRYVVAWRLSDSLEQSFCLETLDEALTTATPEISNTDQGSHFTSAAFLERLQTKEVRISMDGRGRCMDNIFTERLWRTVKYEDVFLKSYQNLQEAQAGLTEYFQFYNHERPHQSLDYRTPAAVYFGE